MAFDMITLGDRGICNDVECKLSTCVLQDASKQECNHHDVLNGASRFVVKHTIQDILVYDLATWVAKAMVASLKLHTSENFVKLSVLIFIVLQIILFLNSRFETRLYDPLRSCW